MKKSDQLKNERKQKLEAQKSMIEARNASDSKEFSADEATSFRAITTEIDALDAKIEDAEAIERQEARIASMAGVTVGKSEEKEKQRMIKDYSLHKALRSQLPGKSLDGIEAEYDQEMRAKAKASGVSIQGVAVPNGAGEKRAAGQTVTQDSGAYGANLVVDEYKGVIENLQARPIVESLGAVYMRGLVGDAVFPTNDGGITATWETEIATVAATKNAYGKKTMSPNRLSATTVVSLQNLLQSTPDLERITSNDIRSAFERAIDAAAINGSGSGEPEGILNATGIGVLTGATNGIAPSWAQLVEMETKVFEANAAGGNLNYLVTPGTKGLLKSTAHTANNAYYLMDTNNQINGYGVGVSNLVPSNLAKGSGTDLHAALFGDFSQLLIGEWGLYDMVVDNITQKKSGNIEITVNQFLDVLVRQPSAFAVSKDFII